MRNHHLPIIITLSNLDFQIRITQPERTSEDHLKNLRMIQPEGPSDEDLPSEDPALARELDETRSDLSARSTRSSRAQDPPSPALTRALSEKAQITPKPADPSPPALPPNSHMLKFPSIEPSQGTQPSPHGKIRPAPLIPFSPPKDHVFKGINTSNEPSHQPKGAHGNQPPPSMPATVINAPATIAINAPATINAFSHISHMAHVQHKGKPSRWKP